MHAHMKTVGASKRLPAKDKEKPAPAAKPVESSAQPPQPQQAPPLESDDSGRPWTQASTRPVWADSPKDNSFTIEDEGHVSAVEAVMACFVVIDPLLEDNPLVFVSPGFEKLTGYTSEELLGENFTMLQRKKGEPDTGSSLREAMSKSRFVSVELNTIRKDGRKFRCLVCLMPVLDAKDNLCKYVGIYCDVERNNERAMFASKWTEQVTTYIRAFAITDSSQDGCPIFAVNEAFTTMTGYGQAEIRGCSISCLAGPDSSRSTVRRLLSGHTSEKPTSLRMMCYKRDGSPFCGYLWSCPLWERGLGSGPYRRHLVVAVDVTTNKMRRMGKFMMGKVIGQGASGIVYKGINTTTDEVVAIKTVDASRFRSISEIEQMQEEMNVSASLKHPNIIRLFEVHFNNNVFYLVMELSSGGSLMKYIHDRGSNCLDEAETLRLFVQMVSALDYCHRRRIIHRDLKPENILMDSEHSIKIADFGLAAISGFSSGLTLQCGTPEFTAPEITTGKEYDGPSVDLWSLGVILYEMLTGKLPFQGPTQAALFKAIQKGVYEPLPSYISQECKDLVSGMLNTNPSKRFAMDDIIRHPWLRGELGRRDDMENKSGGADGVAHSDSSDDLTSPSDLSNNGSAVDLTPAGISESVRIVIPGGMDKDDPIMAAMMRTHGIMTEDEEAGSRLSHSTPAHTADKHGSTNSSSRSGASTRPGGVVGSGSSTPNRSVRPDPSDSRTTRPGGPATSTTRPMAKGLTPLRKTPVGTASTATGHTTADRRAAAHEPPSRAGRPTAVSSITSPTEAKRLAAERDKRMGLSHGDHSPAHRPLPAAKK